MPAAPTRYLLLRAGDTLCAVPLGQVRRVVRALIVHPLPGAAPEFLGLAEFLGEPLPVLDLAALVGSVAASATSAAVTVVARIGNTEPAEVAGLNADEALEIVSLAPPAAGGGMGRRGIVAGEALAGERRVTVLDLAAWRAAA